MSTTRKPHFAAIEVVEWVDEDTSGKGGVVVNDLLIDGKSYEAPAGAIIETRAGSESMTEVTLTLLASSVRYRQREREPKPRPTLWQAARSAAKAKLDEVLDVIAVMREKRNYRDGPEWPLTADKTY